MDGVVPGEGLGVCASGSDAGGGEPQRPASAAASKGLAKWGPESDLIGGVRDGDPASMAVLYERHREQGLRFARSLMSRPEDAEDVLHEAFAKAVSAIRNGYGPTEALGPYLSTCLRSAANSVWKKLAREKPAPFEDLDPGPVEDPGLEGVLSVFEHEDVASAMRQLPPRWRTVLWHAEVLGEPPRTIAPLLGIEANAVSALLIRARAGLRAAYERQPGTAGRGEFN